MRILNIIYITTFIILLNSCGLSHMANKYNTVNYVVNPENLEAHAGKITLDLEANFPEKYFAKQATVSLTPVLVYETGETAFKTIKIQGEEATGGEKTIFYATGGKFSYQDNIDYEKKMNNSRLEIRAIAKLKDKLRSAANLEDQEQILGPINIASGVMATSRRVFNNEDLANDNHAYEHETIIEKTATIYFLVNQSKIRTTEKSDEDIKQLTDFVKNKYKTHSIEIMSYASPEGSVNTNENVSEKRMKSTMQYTKNLLKTLKVDGADNNELYTETSIGEDWEGFESIVKLSQMKDKRRINKIVNSVEDVELREQQIRDLSEIYDALKDNVLPQLRKAVIVIRSFEPKRSDEEIANLSITSPDSLDLKELLFSATLNNDKNVQASIYNSVIELHNDWRGYNNLACIHLSENDLDKAMEFLDRAENVLGGKGQHDILTNKGIIYARKGELKKAQKLFDQANTTELNQAILDIRQGEYNKAARYFKNKTSYNATLAQMMNGNNSVNCNENTASCSYLNAIIAARRGENDLAISNLTKAVSADANYKIEAINDIEFINLRTSELFIKLTE